MKRYLLTAGIAVFLTISGNPLLADITADEVVEFIETKLSKFQLFDFNYENKFETDQGVTLSGATIKNGSLFPVEFETSFDMAVFEESENGAVSISVSSPIRTLTKVPDANGITDTVSSFHHEGYNIHVQEENSKFRFRLVERNARVTAGSKTMMEFSAAETQIDVRITPPIEISWRGDQYETKLGSDRMTDGVSIGVMRSNGDIEIQESPEGVISGKILFEADSIEVGEDLLARIAPDLNGLFRDPSSFIADFSMVAKRVNEDEFSTASIKFHEVRANAAGVRLLLTGDLAVSDFESMPERPRTLGQVTMVVDGGAELLTRLKQIPGKNALLLAAGLKFIFGHGAPGPGGEDSKLFNIEFTSDGKIWVNDIDLGQ